MDEKTTVATMAFGMEAMAGETDLLGLGEMGIGNTTIAAAIYAALYGGDTAASSAAARASTTPGMKRKVEAVEKALATHAGHLDDPLEVLRRLGGREIAAMAGAILAARLQRVPVVLDGYVVTAAAAVLHAIAPTALDHCIAGHVSAEGAHREVLERLGKRPLLDLGMRLGEGTGAALAMGLIKAAAACHRDMATFSTAGVSNLIRRHAGGVAASSAAFGRALWTGVLVGMVGAASLYMSGLRRENLTGQAYAIDGDFLRLGGVEIRLEGLDAPEYRQACQVGGTMWHVGTPRGMHSRAGSRVALCSVRWAGPTDTAASWAIAASPGARSTVNSCVWDRPSHPAITAPRKPRRVPLAVASGPRASKARPTGARSIHGRFAEAGSAVVLTP